MAVPFFYKNIDHIIGTKWLDVMQKPDQLDDVRAKMYMAVYGKEAPIFEVRTQGGQPQLVIPLTADVSVRVWCLQISSDWESLGSEDEESKEGTGIRTRTQVTALPLPLRSSIHCM